MTDTSGTADCDYCGETFKTQGLATHERYCDAKEIEEAETVPDDGAGDDEHVTEWQTMFDELETSIVERDDRACVRCGADAEITVHQVDPNRSRERNNLVTLCEDCEDELARFHPRTKRTLIAEHDI